MLDSDVSFRLLDLNLLRVLDALTCEGSVAGAATRLSITPSAVSHALGRLRALFNDPLFIRSATGMRATPRAAEIGPKVREALRALEGALTPTEFLARESSRVFTVACSAYVAAVLLPGVIAQLRQRAPRAGLNVVSWGPGVMDRFEAGQIDLLIGDFARVPVGFALRPLFDDRPVWLMGRDYVLQPGAARRVPAELEQARPHLPERTVLESGFLRRVVDECCGIVGNPVDGACGGTILESLPFALIAPLVVKHAGLAALLPRRLALLFAQDLKLDIAAPMPAAVEDGIHIGAVCHPDHGQRPPVVWFLDLLAEVAGAPACAMAAMPCACGERKVGGEEPHALPRRGRGAPLHRGDVARLGDAERR
jgi:DNA-binding transcriptional LysR family regulator